MNEKPDLMLSEDPHWAKDDCSQTAGHGNISYWPDNGTEKLTHSKETENKLLDGPATALERWKYAFPACWQGNIKYWSTYREQYYSWKFLLL